MRSIRTFLLGLLVTLTPAVLSAQQHDSTAIAELRQRLDAVTRELERMELQRSDVPLADTMQSGLAPAASKVYRVRQGVSLGGYGEMLYQNFAGTTQAGDAAGQSDRLDALRAVVYVGYRFSDHWLFNSEIEFEHANTEDGGEAALEFGYLEYRPAPEFGVRAGLLLAPMGLLNEMHEPTTWLGATRPLTETYLIPSTWRENGIGIVGDHGIVSYRAYAMAGLKGVTGYSADEGLREGRQGGSKSLAENFGVVGRVDVTPQPGLMLGGSGFIGNSGQGTVDGEGALHARTSIIEGHVQYRARGLDLRALGALASVDDAARINALQGLTGDASIGSRLTGWYVQGGYDLLHSSRTAAAVLPYVRYEQVNTQQEVPEGFAADPANDRQAISLGVMWKPISMVAVKGEYQINRNDADTGVNRVNLAVGYLF
ncbi:MAG TPA: hypothetical protein VFK36_14615 [Gemmatimonadales bacterium]|nr:hypothetical protein [Gemmatimonadales bacterium]